MIEKIKNFMSNSNTTDLVSYSDEDDYSNFWKDLKPIKYESPIEILRNHANNFNTNSSLGPKYHLNIEIDNGNASEWFRSVKLFFTVSSGNKIYYYRDVLKLTQNIETLFPITIENYLENSEETNCYIYEQPYAHYVYEGISKNGKPLNYHTDKHPLAGSHWDKRMVSAEMQDIVKEVQDFIDRGGK